MAVILLLALAKTTDAQAETQICQGEPNCEQHLAQASSLYDRGDYSGARAEYLLAYGQMPHPQLLLLLGRTNYKLCQLAEARDYYERFQRADPDPDPTVAGKLQRYLRELGEANQCPGQALTPPLKNAPIAKVNLRPIYKHAWFWGVIGGGAALGLALGLGLGLQTAASEPFVRAHPIPTE